MVICNCFLWLTPYRQLYSDKLFSLQMSIHSQAFKCRETSCQVVYPETERGRVLLAPTQQGIARRLHHSVPDGLNPLSTPKCNRAIITAVVANPQLLRTLSAFPKSTMEMVQGISQQTSHLEMNLGYNSHNFQTYFPSVRRRASSRFSPGYPDLYRPSEEMSQAAVLTHFALC